MGNTSTFVTQHSALLDANPVSGEENTYPRAFAMMVPILHCKRQDQGEKQPKTKWEEREKAKYITSKRAMQ